MDINSPPSIFFTADKTPPGFPIITQSPATRVIEIGHTAIMQCKATGQPNPKIYWLKDMKKVDMNNPRYSLLDGTKFNHLFTLFNIKKMKEFNPFNI